MNAPTAEMTVNCTQFGASRIYTEELEAFCRLLPVLNQDRIGVTAVAIIVDPAAKNPNNEVTAAERIVDAIQRTTRKNCGIDNAAAVLGLIGPCNCVGYDKPVYAIVFYAVADLLIATEKGDEDGDINLEAVAEAIQPLVENTLRELGLTNKIVVGVEEIGDTLDILNDSPVIPQEFHTPGGEVIHIIIGFDAGDECNLIFNEPPVAQTTGTKCDTCPERGTCVVFAESLIHGSVPIGAMPSVVLPPSDGTMISGVSIGSPFELRLSDGTLVPPLTSPLIPTRNIVRGMDIGRGSGDRSGVFVVFPGE